MEQKRLPAKTAVHTPASGTTVLVNYSTKEKLLEVEFTGGKTYHYFGVPEKVWNEYLKIILSGGSSGVFVNTHIKPFYKYEEV